MFLLTRNENRKLDSLVNTFGLNGGEGFRNRVENKIKTKAPISFELFSTFLSSYLFVATGRIPRTFSILYKNIYIYIHVYRSDSSYSEHCYDNNDVKRTRVYVFHIVRVVPRVYNIIRPYVRIVRGFSLTHAS